VQGNIARYGYRYPKTSKGYRERKHTDSNSKKTYKGILSQVRDITTQRNWAEQFNHGRRIEEMSDNSQETTIEKQACSGSDGAPLLSALTKSPIHLFAGIFCLCIGTILFNGEVIDYANIILGLVNFGFYLSD
jgi:hypothetical protein